MKIKLTNILALPVLALSSISAHAAMLVYEPFDMATGDLNGKSSTGSIGLSSSWTATAGSTADHQVTSTPALDYGDLGNSGNYIVTTATNGSSDGSVTIGSSISNAGNLDDAESLWFSVIINPAVTSNGHNGFAFGSDVIAGAFNGVSMANSGNGVGIYWKNGGGMRVAKWESGALASSAAFTVSGSSLLVGQISWTATGETLTLYNPSLVDLETLGSGFSISTTANVDQSTFDTISYTTRGSAGSNSFDEIRFGQSYADVSPIPEPSAALLGGLGLLALLRRRR